MVFAMEWMDGLIQIFFKTVNMFVVSENAPTIKAKILLTTLLVTGPVWHVHVVCLG